MAQIQHDANQQRAAQMRFDAQQMRSAMAMQRQAEQARRAYERAQRADERERQRLYVEDRLAETDALNDERTRQVSALKAVLTTTITRNYAFDVHSMKKPLVLPAFDPGAVATPLQPPSPQQFLPTEPTSLQKLIPGTKERYVQAYADGYQHYEYAYAAYQQQEYYRQSQLSDLWKQHEMHVASIKAEISTQHAEVDRWERSIASGEPDAVGDYFATVLDDDIFPEEFPNTYDVCYVSPSRELVIEYDLPPLSIIPEVTTYRYVKVRDEIAETWTTPTQREAMYQDMIAQTALSVLAIVTNADQYRLMNAVVFSGFADGIDRASGRPIRPCLVSVRAEKSTIQQLDLARVDALACLKHLRASTSKNMSEATSVKPILTVEAATVSSEASSNHDSRHGALTNLMDLSPLDFEQLIANLFRSMGLETELTKASHDGGIDCFAYDRDPILGGEIVIQAKRYRHTVSVSVVRDLFGAVQDRRAMKGILVTTSGYGSDARKFVADKPLQLIDGPLLVDLLDKQMRMAAYIDMPEGPVRLLA
jgi:restriction system protein